MTLDDLNLDPFIHAVLQETPEPMRATLLADLREAIEEKVREYFADPRPADEQDAGQ